MILQINSVFGVGSTGRIVKELREFSTKAGYECNVVYGRGLDYKQQQVFKVGSAFDNRLHAMITRVSDRHGFGSFNSTKKLIKLIEDLNPKIIHIHNIHGYYLNVKLLFEYIKETKKPTIWTLHDCWPFTGHCAYYEYFQCNKWKWGCSECGQIHKYPASWGVDASKKNYNDKRKLFYDLPNLTIVTPSDWLCYQVNQSFLKNYPVRTIYNGLDLSVFSPSTNMVIYSLRNKYKVRDKFIIIGVANIWEERKGLKYFSQLSEQLDDNYKIIIVGVTENQRKKLPSNVIGITRTQNVEELVKLYSMADVFVNPTLEETFGLTNIEALACGTPVITFNTGGSPESIDKTCGIVVEKGSVDGLIKAIEHVRKNPFSAEACRKRAMMFDKNNKYAEYIKLYEEILAKQA